MSGNNTAKKRKGLIVRNMGHIKCPILREEISLTTKPKENILKEQPGQAWKDSIRVAVSEGELDLANKTT